ncbi:NAD(P)-binding domain-containing protein [Streptomyces avermitilis]|uniref:NAD(P)-binding domain-containing protein n=1 Tax=Streptomyces avermitilis TaxID=33903 RepID=UPI003685CBB9
MSGTVAFIGLGHMGGPMAANVVKAGHRVQGHDVVAAALDTAAGAGIAPATSAAEAVVGGGTSSRRKPAAGAHPVVLGLLARLPGPSGLWG